MKVLLEWLRSRRARAPERFPDGWRRLLAARYEHFRRLPADIRLAFESGVQRFLAERLITGVKMKVDAELRLLVAASAATLSAAWPGYRWSQVSEVLVYPDYFDRDFVMGPRELAGVADHWGTVVISAPALRRSFKEADDGYHVGLHEFAHLLDVEQSAFDGIPRGLRTAEIREWLAIQEGEMEKVRRGRSVLDSYAGNQPQEFFPVAVETFFERPVRLRRGHPRLYEFLRGYFGQDPAAWAASADEDEGSGVAFDGPVNE